MRNPLKRREKPSKLSKDEENKKLILEKQSEERTRTEAQLRIIEDSKQWIKDESDRTGLSIEEVTDNLLQGDIALIEFDETAGKASLVFKSWTSPMPAIGETQKLSERVIADFRSLRENFAPVAAGIEWHRDFSSGGGFTVQINDPKDPHKAKMKAEIEKFCRNVYQDQLTVGLDNIDDIMMDTALTDGCAAAEIVYDVEVEFMDYVNGFEDVVVENQEGKKVMAKVMIPREPNWHTDLKKITRLKIIDDAYNRLRPYRHPKSGEILFWTLDEKVKVEWSSKAILNKNVIKFHPWEIFWLSWNQRGTNLKGMSMIQPVYSVAKFVQAIQKAVGVGFNRWANKKYFFVCGSEKRPWSKPAQKAFLTAMARMIKNNYVGIPVPPGFKIENIGGEGTVFEGTSLLDYLTGQICLVPDTPIITEEAIKNIEDVEFGDKVLTEDGQFRPTEKTFKRWFNGELVIIQPHYGLPVKITPNHPIWIWRDEKEQQIRADEVKETDLLSFPIPQFNVEQPNQSLDFMKLLGYYIGDGYSRIERGGWIYIVLNQKERDKVLELTKIITTLYEYPRITIRHRKSQNVILFGFRDMELAKWLKKNCGNTALDKHVPQHYMNMTNEQFEALFDGLMKSDGCKVKRDNIFIYATTSKRLMGQIYLLSMKYGLTPAITRVPPMKTKWSQAKGGKEVWSKESWRISFRKTPISKIVNKLQIPIYKISRQSYDGYVYNIQVNSNHTYTTLNMLVSNCAGMQYPREFLEMGKTQGSDKAWLAWTVRYGRNQQQIRRAIEHQLWERELWCVFGKKYRVSKKGVKITEQEQRDIYVPTLQWRAEGRWHREKKTEMFKSLLDAANPIDPPLKMAVQKGIADVLGFGAIDWETVTELFEIRSETSLLEAKLMKLEAKAKLEITEELSKSGKLVESIKAREEAKLEMAKQQKEGGVPSKEELDRRAGARLEGGVSRTPKGVAKPMGGTREPKRVAETIPTSLLPKEEAERIAKAMIETEKIKQEKLKVEIEKSKSELKRFNKKVKLMDELQERMNKKKTVKTEESKPLPFVTSGVSPQRVKREEKEQKPQEVKLDINVKSEPSKVDVDVNVKSPKELEETKQREVAELEIIKQRKEYLKVQKEMIEEEKKEKEREREAKKKLREHKRKVLNKIEKKVDSDE